MKRQPVNDGCGEYCNHNAVSECRCQPCEFIRTVGFAHANNCKYGENRPGR